VRGDPEDVYPTGGVLEDEERVEPLQGDRVEVKHVAGQDRLGVGVEELRPGRPDPPRRGIDPSGVEDLPHRGGADLVAESSALTVHAPVSPSRILGGQAHGQGTDASGNGGAARPHGLGGPAASDEMSVPAQDRGRSDEESVAPMSRKQSCEGSDHGAVGPDDLWSRCASL